MQCVAMCVAACCSVLQCGVAHIVGASHARQAAAPCVRCVAVWCIELQCVAVCYSATQCVAGCCSVLQCAAVCCSVLRCVAVCCSVIESYERDISLRNTSCSVLQCIAVCCSLLQFVAVCCSVISGAFRGTSHARQAAASYMSVQVQCFKKNSSRLVFFLQRTREKLQGMLLSCGS